jgi:hypothetical protein
MILALSVHRHEHGSSAGTRSSRFGGHTGSSGRESVRRSAHKVTGLQGLCALNTLELENLAIVPNTSP